MFNILSNLPNCFPMMLYSFTFLPAKYKDPGSTSSPTLGIICLFGYGQPGGCEMVSLYGLNLCVPDGS